MDLLSETLEQQEEKKKPEDTSDKVLVCACASVQLAWRYGDTLTHIDIGLDIGLDIYIYVVADLARYCPLDQGEPAQAAPCCRPCPWPELPGSLIDPSIDRSIHPLTCPMRAGGAEAAARVPPTTTSGPSSYSGMYNEPQFDTPSTFSDNGSLLMLDASSRVHRRTQASRA